MEVVSTSNLVSSKKNLMRDQIGSKYKRKYEAIRSFMMAELGSTLKHIYIIYMKEQNRNRPAINERKTKVFLLKLQTNLVKTWQD